MAEYTALIEQLCARRSALVRAMAANPGRSQTSKSVTLLTLHSALVAVEAEHQRAEREMLRQEVQERTGALPSLP